MTDWKKFPVRGGDVLPIPRPPQWTPLEKIVAEHERDPGTAERLRAARKRLAPILYPDGGPQYERMTRGLGPPCSETCGCEPGVCRLW